MDGGMFLTSVIVLKKSKKEKKKLKFCKVMIHVKILNKCFVYSGSASARLYQYLLKQLFRHSTHMMGNKQLNFNVERG